MMLIDGPTKKQKTPPKQAHLEEKCMFQDKRYVTTSLLGCISKT